MPFPPTASCKFIWTSESMHVNESMMFAQAEKVILFPKTVADGHFFCKNWHEKVDMTKLHERLNWL